MQRLHYHVKTLVRHLTTSDSHMADIVDEVVALKDDVALEAVDVDTANNSCWQAKGRHSLFQIAACACALLSLLVVFCEVTIVSNRNISLLGLLVQSLRQHVVIMQLASVIPLCYLSYCTYYPLFQLRLSTLYWISVKRTDPVSLLFNATLLLRVSTSLSLNYVQLLHFDSAPSSSSSSATSTDDTATSATEAVTSVVRNLDVLPLFGRKFSEVFPVCIALVCLLTYFDVLPRLLARVGLIQYQPISSHELNTAATGGTVSDRTQEIIDCMSEGQACIKQELRRRERRLMTQVTSDDEAANEQEAQTRRNRMESVRQPHAKSIAAMQQNGHARQASFARQQTAQSISSSKKPLMG